MNIINFFNLLNNIPAMILKEKYIQNTINNLNVSLKFI